MFDYEVKIWCDATRKRVDIDVSYINQLANALTIYPSNIAHQLTHHGFIMVNGVRCAIKKKYLETDEVYGFPQEAVVAGFATYTKKISFNLDGTTYPSTSEYSRYDNITVCIAQHWLEVIPHTNIEDVKEQHLGGSCVSTDCEGDGAL